MGPTRRAASLKTRQAHQLPEKKKGGGKAPACARLRERGREYHPDDAERHRDEKGEADDAANQHEPYQERVTDPERARASHSREKPHAMTTTNTITNVSMTYSFPATIKPEPFGPPQGVAVQIARFFVSMVEFPYCVGRLLRALVEPFENGRCYHRRRYGRDPHSSPPNPGGCMPPGWWVYGLGAICAVSALLWLLRGRILCKPASLQRLLAKALGLCPCARLFRSAGLWIQAPANALIACLRGLARFRAMLPFLLVIASLSCFQGSGLPPSPAKAR